MTTKQIAELRGMAEQEWERYSPGGLGECLNCLAVVYGFPNGSRMLPWKLPGDTGWTHHCNLWGGLHVGGHPVIGVMLLLLAWVLVMLDGPLEF